MTNMALVLASWSYSWHETVEACDPGGRMLLWDPHHLPPTTEQFKRHTPTTHNVWDNPGHSTGQQCTHAGV